MEMKWLSLKYIQSKGVLMLLVQQTTLLNDMAGRREVDGDHWHAGVV